MSGLSLSNLLTGGSHVRKTDLPERPTNSQAKFTPGMNPSKYLTYDKKQLVHGNTYYQLNNRNPKTKIEVSEVVVKELLQNDQARVEDVNTKEVFVTPSKQLHSDKKELLMIWYVNTKYALEVDLPESFAIIKKLLKETDSTIDFDSLIVGEGLDDEEI